MHNWAHRRCFENKCARNAYISILGWMCMNISSYIFIRAHTLHGAYVQELEERVDRWWMSMKRNKRLRWTSNWNEGIAWENTDHKMSCKRVFIKWGNMSIYTTIRIYMSICTQRRIYSEVAKDTRGSRREMAVSYSVSESAGMMKSRARDNSYTPYESAGMIESDHMRVWIPLGLWLVRRDSNYRAPL